MFTQIAQIFFGMSRFYPHIKCDDPNHIRRSFKMSFKSEFYGCVSVQTLWTLTSDFPKHLLCHSQRDTQRQRRIRRDGGDSEQLSRIHAAIILITMLQIHNISTINKFRWLHYSFNNANCVFFLLFINRQSSPLVFLCFPEAFNVCCGREVTLYVNHKLRRGRETPTISHQITIRSTLDYPVYSPVIKYSPINIFRSPQTWVGIINQTQILQQHTV